MYPGSLQPENWLSFFASVAQVSGGLVGLVFLAMTFKPQLLGSAGDIGMRALARQTFSDFLNVLMVSLLMQVPYSNMQISAFLAVIGVVGAQRVVRSVISVRRGASASDTRRPVLTRLYLSLLGNAALLSAGAVVLIRDSQLEVFASLLVTGLLLLLLAGSRSAWMLVTHDA